MEVMETTAPNVRLLLFIGLILFSTGCGRKEPEIAKTARESSPVPAPSVSIYQSTGTVISINPKFPSVELQHEEIIGLMPAMNMEFYVKDASLLTGLKAGDKIRFTMENGIGGLEITEIVRY